MVDEEGGSESIRHVEKMLRVHLCWISRGGKVEEEVGGRASKVGFNLASSRVVLVGEVSREDGPYSRGVCSVDAVDLWMAIGQEAYVLGGGHCNCILTIFGGKVPGVSNDVCEFLDAFRGDIGGRGSK